MKPVREYEFAILPVSVGKPSWIKRPGTPPQRVTITSEVVNFDHKTGEIETKNRIYKRITYN